MTRIKTHGDWRVSYDETHQNTTTVKSYQHTTERIRTQQGDKTNQTHFVGNVWTISPGYNAVKKNALILILVLFSILDGSGKMYYF